MFPEITAFSGTEHHAFTLEGHKPAVVLVHGFPGTPDEMRPTAEVFHSMGWTAHAVLLPGFGPEINDLNKRTHKEWLQTICSAIHAFRLKGHAPIVLAGNSMGGALAIEACVQTGADGLVLFAPFYKIDHFLWTLLPFIKIVLPTFKPFRFIHLDFTNPETREGILRFMPELDLDDPATQKAVREFRVPVAMFHHIRTAGQNAYQTAPQVRCPVICFQGSQDELVTPENTRRLIQRFQGKTEYITFDGDHDLVRKDRPSWTKIKRSLEAFSKQFIETSQEGL